MIVLVIVLCDDVLSQHWSEHDVFLRGALVDVENHDFACFSIFDRHVPGLCGFFVDFHHIPSDNLACMYLRLVIDRSVRGKGERR